MVEIIKAPEKSLLVSVITVTYNAEKYLEETIQSVITQTYNNVEYLIIDGGSTDNTLDIIKQHQDRIRYWVSEPDEGIYDAMNKGISASQGSWILFLGSDDYLFQDSTIEKVINSISNDEIVIHGNVVLDNGIKILSRISNRTIFSNTLHHQSAFYHRKLFTNFRYDTLSKVYSDYELNLIIYLNKYRTQYINEVISFCRLGGVSDINKKVYIDEMIYLRSKHLNRLHNFLITQIWLLLRQIKSVITIR